MTGVRESFRDVTLKWDLGDKKGIPGRETAAANVPRPKVLGFSGAVGSAGYVASMVGGEQEPPVRASKAGQAFGL